MAGEARERWERKITSRKTDGREHAEVKLEGMDRHERERCGERARWMGRGLAGEGGGNRAEVEVEIVEDTVHVRTNNASQGTAMLIARGAVLAGEVARESGRAANPHMPVQRWTALGTEQEPHLWMAGWKGDAPKHEIRALTRAATDTPGSWVWPHDSGKAHLDLGDGTHVIAAVVPDRAAAERLAARETLERARRREREDGARHAQAMGRWRAPRGRGQGRKAFGIDAGESIELGEEWLRRVLGAGCAVRATTYNAEHEEPIGEVGERRHWLIETDAARVRETWERAHLARGLGVHLRNLKEALAQGKYTSWSVHMVEFGGPGTRRAALSAVAADHDEPALDYTSGLCEAVEKTLAKIEGARWLALTHYGWSPAAVSIGYAGQAGTAYVGCLAPEGEHRAWASASVVNAAIERTLATTRGERTQ